MPIQHEGPEGTRRTLVCGNCEHKVRSYLTDSELYLGGLECPRCEGTDWHDAATGRACEPEHSNA